jgi:hypothetical protein
MKLQAASYRCAGKRNIPGRYYDWNRLRYVLFVSKIRVEFHQVEQCF